MPAADRVDSQPNGTRWRCSGLRRSLLPLDHRGMQLQTVPTHQPTRCASVRSPASPAAARAPRAATQPPRRRATLSNRGVSLPDASRASDRKDSIPRHGRLLHPSTWAERDDRDHAAENFFQGGSPKQATPLTAPATSLTTGGGAAHTTSRPVQKKVSAPFHRSSFEMRCTMRWLVGGIRPTQRSTIFPSAIRWEWLTPKFSPTLELGRPGAYRRDGALWPWLEPASCLRCSYW